MCSVVLNLFTVISYIHLSLLLPVHVYWNLSNIHTFLSFVTEIVRFSNFFYQTCNWKSDSWEGGEYGEILDFRFTLYVITLLTFDKSELCIEERTYILISLSIFPTAWSTVLQTRAYRWDSGLLHAGSEGNPQWSWCQPSSYRNRAQWNCPGVWWQERWNGGKTIWSCTHDIPRDLREWLHRHWNHQVKSWIMYMVRVSLFSFFCVVNQNATIDVNFSCLSFCKPCAPFFWSQ